MNKTLISHDALSGAEFSKCHTYRFRLWRIWNRDKPLVMFIGLNPSTANDIRNDQTIRRVCDIARNNGYGGVFMMNCFPFITPYPVDLGYTSPEAMELNNIALQKTAAKCKDVVFAWGNFDIVRTTGRDKELEALFPNAKALFINKNGSPKHPLYCRADIKFITYQNQQQCAIALKTLPKLPAPRSKKTLKQNGQ